MAERVILESALASMKRELLSMLSYHSQVYVVELTIYATGERSEVTFSSWLGCTLKKLKRKLRLHRYSYFWAHEVTKLQISHWHLILFVDGHKFKSGFRFMELANYRPRAEGSHTVQWTRYSRCPRSYTARRGDADGLAKIIDGLAYYCKSDTKVAGNHLRRYGASRLPPRPLTDN